MFDRRSQPPDGVILPQHPSGPAPLAGTVGHVAVEGRTERPGGAASVRAGIRSAQATGRADRAYSRG